MPNPLTPKRRSELRAEAHKLGPVVIIGDKGLTDEVLAEIDRSLKAHELIKVRAATDERDARDLWLDEICLKLEAHAVQQIGKVFVLYRENPEAARKKAAPAPAPRRRPPPAAAKPGGPRSGAKKRKPAGAPVAAKRKRFGGDEQAKRTRFAARGEPQAERFGEGGEEARKGGTGARRTSRPPPRTPSPRPASGPRRRPRNTSR